MSDQKSDVPDTPAEVLARQAKGPLPLTAVTADLIGAKSYMDDSGHEVTGQRREVSNAAKDARERAEAFAGGTPIKGLTPERVAAIKGKTYEDSPEMTPEQGDRTPAFVNWLWANHPNEAKVRYAYRAIWPSVLPVSWLRVEAKPKPVVNRKKPAPTTATTSGPTVVA